MLQHNGSGFDFQVHTRACSLGASVALFTAALSMALPSLHPVI